MYEKEYAQKLMTAEEAVKLVKSGDWVDYGWCTGTAYTLDKALTERMRQEPELTDIKLRGGVLLWEPEIFRLEDGEHRFSWNSWHMSAIERRAIAKGFSYYAPIRFSEVPWYYRDLENPTDIALFQVTPMDKHGYFNFGPSAVYQMNMCKRAKKIIVEVNTNMPRALGGFGEAIHISEIDCVVEGENPPMGILKTGVSTEVDNAVAKRIVEQIPNGACLQLGIGGMPNAVGKFIAESDLKHLGVHTEMMVDGFYYMYQAGKIDGTCKTTDKGRMVYGFAGGSQFLYDFIDDNRQLAMAPIDYINCSDNIALNDNFMSVNNIIDIDLLSQANAESSGTRFISGSGGQQDFVLGAYKSKGGKSFICCSSTYTDKDGVVHSRIRPTLKEGSVVTDTRTSMQYFVTEYNMVNFKGLSTWERAEAIISCAHPDFREELIKSAQELGIWSKTHKIPM